MTSIAVECCAVPPAERRAQVKQEQRPISNWSRVDLDIQAFIRLASGGVEAGFDRILIR